MNDPAEKRRYLELFEEQGWEFVGKTFNGWIYLKNSTFRERRRKNMKFIRIQNLWRNL